MASRASKPHGGDRPLRIVESNPDSPPVPQRPCACCGARFQPTLRRRMLCAHCFRGGDRLPEIERKGDRRDKTAT